MQKFLKPGQYLASGERTSSTDRKLLREPLADENISRQQYRDLLRKEVKLHSGGPFFFLPCPLEKCNFVYAIKGNSKPLTYEDGLPALVAYPGTSNFTHRDTAEWTEKIFYEERDTGAAVVGGGDFKLVNGNLVVEGFSMTIRTSYQKQVQINKNAAALLVNLGADFGVIAAAEGTYAGVSGKEIEEFIQHLRTSPGDAIVFISETGFDGICTGSSKKYCYARFLDNQQKDYFVAVHADHHGAVLDMCRALVGKDIEVIESGWFQNWTSGLADISIHQKEHPGRLLTLDLLKKHGFGID